MSYSLNEAELVNAFREAKGGANVSLNGGGVNESDKRYLVKHHSNNL